MPFPIEFNRKKRSDFLIFQPPLDGSVIGTQLHHDKEMSLFLHIFDVVFIKKLTHFRDVCHNPRNDKTDKIKQCFFSECTFEF